MVRKDYCKVRTVALGEGLIVFSPPTLRSCLLTATPNRPPGKAAQTSVVPDFRRNLLSPFLQFLLLCHRLVWLEQAFLCIVIKPKIQIGTWGKMAKCLLCWFNAAETYLVQGEKMTPPYDPAVFIKVLHSVLNSHLQLRAKCYLPYFAFLHLEAQLSLGDSEWRVEKNYSNLSNKQKGYFVTF